MFDQDSKGIVFNSVILPIKRLGLNFCLNRQSTVWYLQDPKFSKKEAEQETEYLVKLNDGDYFGMQPKFAKDYSKLCFVASEHKFLSHSGNYQLKSLEWPRQAESKAQVVLDYVHEYPKDDQEYAGLYGY